MNRAERRAAHRRVRRDMAARYRCTCTPAIVPAGDEYADIKSAVSGTVYDTGHSPGCPIGDTATALWTTQGVTPVVFGVSPPRCQR
jgi:hypothetical protein